LKRIAFAVLLIAGILKTSSFALQSANAEPPDPCHHIDGGDD
jgi:hypothetical protein